MAETCTVVLGSQQHLEALRELAAESGEVLTFTDKDATAAFEAMTQRRPQVIILERLFAATSRGAALINRIKADPMLEASEIRVVSHDGEYSRVSHRRAPAVATTAATEEDPAKEPESPPAPVVQQDYRVMRRAPRLRMAEGTEAQVDGALVRLVDLSTIGAQVLVDGALKPNQRVRVMLSDDAGVARFNAAVAWAFFEMPKGVTRYRAGLEFQDAKPKEVEAFAARHKI